jgi:hypothetical protein
LVSLLVRAALAGSRGPSEGNIPGGDAERICPAIGREPVNGEAKNRLVPQQEQCADAKNGVKN